MISEPIPARGDTRSFRVDVDFSAVRQGVIRIGIVLRDSMADATMILERS